MIDIGSITASNEFSLNMGWLNVLAPDDGSNPALDNAIAELKAVQQALSSGSLQPKGVLHLLAELQVVRRIVRVKTHGIYIALDVAQEALSAEYSEQFPEYAALGAATADYLLDESPGLLPAWHHIVQSHSKVFNWFNTLVGGRLVYSGDAYVLSLGLDYGGAKFSHSPTQSKWIPYVAFVIGYCQRIQEVYDKVLPLILVRNPVWKALRINPSLTPDANAISGISRVGTLAAKMGVLHRMINSANGVRPEPGINWYANEASLLTRLLRHEVFKRETMVNPDFAKAVRLQQEILLRRPAGSRSNLDVIEPPDMTEALIVAATDSTVAPWLFQRQPLADGYWEAKTQRYFADARERELAGVAKAREFATMLGWQGEGRFWTNEWQLDPRFNKLTLPAWTSSSPEGLLNHDFRLEQMAELLKHTTQEDDDTTLLDAMVKFSRMS